MNESEYLSIPECYMKEIPKNVWYSWPIEIRKEFFQMISDPNFFFYNSRPFNEEIYDGNIALSDYEKKEFWKRVDYFFLNLGITNLRNLDNLWGYFAIPFKHRTGDFLKNYFYLPENKKKVNSTLSYYNISSNSTQPPLVKIQLIKREAQIFILSFIRDYINSASLEPHIANLPLNAANYADQIRQNFIANCSIANENIADGQDTGSYSFNFPPTDLSVGFRSNIKNNFKSFFDSNRQNLNDRNQIQPLKILVNQIQKTITNEERMAIAAEKRNRGRQKKPLYQDSPSSQASKKPDKKNISSEKEEEYIEKDQNSEDLRSSDEKNDTDIAGYEDNSNISDHIENQPQAPINNHKSDEISNSDNNDEEIKDSDISLKDFIASDNSYDYITEDQDDDDDDDGEYQEISTRFRKYNSTKGKRKRNSKKQSKNLKLDPIKQINSKKLTKDGGNNFINHQRYNQYSNSAFNPYNNEANFNQIYNNGRYPNLSIINANPLPQNQQQFYKFNNNPQFIQEGVKFGIHPPVNPSQIGYQQIFQIAPQLIPNNQFNAIQAANEIKIAPLTPINQPSIQILQGPIQSLIPAQVRPIQPANIPINNYSNIIVSGNLSSAFPQLGKKAQLVKIDIDQPLFIPIKPISDSSLQLKPNKKATQYQTPRVDEKPLPEDSILTPKKVPESNISNSNTNNSVPNSENNNQFIYPSYNNNDNLTYQQKPQVPNYNNPISIQSQTKDQQQPKQSPQPQSQQNPPKPPSNYQPQPLNDVSKKQISDKNEYDDEYEYENNQYNSYSDGNKSDDENYSSNNEASSKNSNFSAAQQTSESAIESEHQNSVEADSENSDFYDKKIENDSKINLKEFNQADEDSNLHTKKFILRTRQKLAKGNHYNSDDDYENDEMIGIVSHLSYLYDENSNKNEYSRISKVKPSDLIDLEFVEH